MLLPFNVRPDRLPTIHRSPLKQLRRQVYTLRFDINNLVEAKGGSPADAKAFYKTVSFSPPTPFPPAHVIFL